MKDHSPTCSDTTVSTTCVCWCLGMGTSCCNSVTSMSSVWDWGSVTVTAGGDNWHTVTSDPTLLTSDSTMTKYWLFMVHKIPFKTNQKWLLSRPLQLTSFKLCIPSLPVSDVVNVSFDVSHSLMGPTCFTTRWLRMITGFHTGSDTHWGLHVEHLLLHTSLNIYITKAVTSSHLTCGLQIFFCKI